MGYLEIDPFLQLSELNAIVRKLGTIFPDANKALENLQRYVENNHTSGKQDDTHIYVVMHVAATGKFEPTRKFVDRVLNCLMSDERALKISVLLATLSCYSVTKSIPSDWFEVNVVQTLNDLLIAISTGNQWKFMHPFVAEIYLRMFCESRGLTCASNFFVYFWEVADGALVNYPKNTKEEREEFAKKLFNGRLAGTDFSPLVERIMKESQSDLLETVLDNGFANQNFGRSFRYILLSRCFRNDRFQFHNYSISLSYAANAFEDLRETDYGFLAQNNLAVSQGYASKNADTEEEKANYYDSMLKLFNELCAGLEKII